MSNVDLFDTYFKRADLDRDGRISGSEAVAFFQGSNLPKNVLAQIWNYADQKRTGFLGRTEFYNSLKLVTIAQSKQELTPDIVRAAFYGPASAKIPAPQINLSATPGPQPNSNITPQLAAFPGQSQNPVLRPALSQNTYMNQQFNLSHNNQSIRPPQPIPNASQGSSRVVPADVISLSNSTLQVNGENGSANGVSAGMLSQVMDRSVNLPATQARFGSGASGSLGPAPRPPASAGMMPSSFAAKTHVTQNGFASGSPFRGDGFSTTISQQKDGPGATSSTSNVPVLSGSVPVSAAALSYAKPGSLETTQVSPSMQPGGGQPQKMQSIPQQPQQFAVQNVSSAPGVPPQVAAVQPQQQWPRLTESDLHKYTETFIKVDKDKDGKITGQEAHDLFLSWGLPKEVLKQVWDLADQDNDSMLSLREFCIALYLMERYREKRPIPSVLPSHIMYNLPPAVQTTGGHPTWGYSHGPQQPVRPGFGSLAPTHPPPGGLQQPAMPGFGPRPPTRPPAGKPPLPLPANTDNRAQPKEPKAKVPVLEKHLVDQLSEGEQKSLNTKFQEATEANKKVEELEKDIKESREKMEFYRVKMQELVLYKSRCDTRLNEMTSRVSADKHEVELLAKKYEEKYKQTGDVASRLTIEEATFRDIQEKKMEMYKAIVKLGQDGTDESLKVRVEQIQSSLEEIVKSLNERCKTYGLRAKPTTIVELPFGWQTGIQTGAADWDEDWDKFEDEGFTSVKELTLDVKNLVAPPKVKSKHAIKETNAIEESGKATASSNAETKTKMADNIFEEAGDSETRNLQQVTENGAVDEQASAFKVKSPMGSPAAKSSNEIPHKEFQEGISVKAVPSPHAKEIKSDHGGEESYSSGNKSFGEPGWGTSNQNDDADSIWGVNPVSVSKGLEDDDLFAPGKFSLNPIKTGSKFGDSGFLKKDSSIFADSVPGTPFSSSYSPQKLNEGPEKYLPSFSRFDSFTSTDSSFQPQEKHLSRFDSMASTDYEYGKGFPSFDDSDPFASGPIKSSSLGGETPRTQVDAFGAGPFKSSFGSETPREPDPFASGPFRSSFGAETPRESDPFGSGPFRSSFGAETPRESDPFGSGPFKSSFGAETPRESDPFKSSFGAETPRESDPFGSRPFKSAFSETPRGDSDPFGSVGPFRSSLGSETPRSEWIGSETPRGDFDSFNYSRPFRSSFDSETPRSEVDPFGSTGPFRSTFGDETPKSDFGYSGSFKSPFAGETPRGATNNWNAF
ncbi:hypothetical protein V2J09_018708 [Rumex salicifolius]